MMVSSLWEKVVSGPPPPHKTQLKHTHTHTPLETQLKHTHTHLQLHLSPPPGGQWMCPILRIWGSEDI